jgi:hypothetical protein
VTFIHRFSRSLQCALTVTDEPPAPGTSHVIACEWTGQPKRKHIAEYRRWILHIHQGLADRWGLSVLYALGVAPDLTEFWSFEPGQAPKLAGVTNASLMKD